MASERSKAIRDLDRYSEHLRKGHNLIAWIPTVYLDLPEIATMVELLQENARTAQLVVDEIVDLINQG